MSRTSIPVDEATKDRLDRLKRDDETWDEFLHRRYEADAPTLEVGEEADTRCHQPHSMTG